MKLAERPEPPAAINDVIVQIHASGFVPTEMAWHDHVDIGDMLAGVNRMGIPKLVASQSQRTEAAAPLLWDRFDPEHRLDRCGGPDWNSRPIGLQPHADAADCRDGLKLTALVFWMPSRRTNRRQFP